MGKDDSRQSSTMPTLLCTRAQTSCPMYATDNCMHTADTPADAAYDKENRREEAGTPTTSLPQQQHTLPAHGNSIAPTSATPFAGATHTPATCTHRLKGLTTQHTATTQPGQTTHRVLPCLPARTDPTGVKQKLQKRERKRKRAKKNKQHNPCTHPSASRMHAAKVPITRPC